MGELWAPATRLAARIATAVRPRDRNKPSLCLDNKLNQSLKRANSNLRGILKSIAPETQKRLIVAIDGPAGAGKSTIARAVAQRLGFTYIDSGAMYRAVALWALRVGVDLDDLHRLEQLAKEARIEFAPGEAVLLNGEDVTTAIRESHVSEAASKVSMAPGVRRAMRDEQRRIGAAQSVVMEGRDIGTVVFPAAQVKIYLDAAPEARAIRRASETGAAVETIAQQIADRDHRDRTRTEAPLTQAPDAEYLDTTRLTLTEVEEAILKLVRERTSNGKGHH
jgi:CMP/dCMP kinase